MVQRLKDLFATARRKRPSLDHLVRAYSRYSADNGDRLAAAVTFYWFLSLFPILLLAISLLGYVYGDQAHEKVQAALGGVLPEQLVQTIGDTLTSAKGPAGVIGLIGTLLSGLGWIDGLREAIRTLWHQNVTAGNVVVKKLVDTVVLIGLFATIGASVVVSGFATAFSSQALSIVGVQSTVGAHIFVTALGYALALLTDMALFLYLFTRLTRVRSPIRRVAKGALFGAVGFEILKSAGAVYVARTTSKGQATYGTFAVVVGLLLFLNLFSRLLLFTAAWTVTEPYDTDVAPSGTASPAMARKAGIPPELADGDPDDPPQLTEGGAPSRLQAAVLGRTRPQDDPTTADGPAGPKMAPVRAGLAVPVGPASPGGTAVATAAHVAIGAGAAVLVGVGLHALGTLRGLVRR